MKINKRGTQHSTSSAQNLIFHSRKNSVNDTPSVNSLIQQACSKEPADKQFAIPCESQPVLKKMVDLATHERVQQPKPSSRQPSQSHVAQGNQNEKESSYMLKIQKYKKMKSELNNQTKQIIKKCINQVGPQGSSQQKSQIQLMTPSSTSSAKHSATQQLLLNKIEQSAKENTNQIANSISLLNNVTNASNNLKAATLKFSINNLLQEIGSRTGVIQGLNTAGIPNTQNNNVTQAQNSTSGSTTAGANASNGKTQSQPKTHASLLQLKNQQHLSSSKMMIALHKKCNSISNSSTSNILNLTAQANVKKVANSSVIDILSNEKQPKHSTTTDTDENAAPLHPNLTSNHQQYLGKTPKVYQKQSEKLKSEINIKKNLSVVSQVEFFDENVRVGEVPQITPRHNKQQPNERYKEVDDTNVRNSYRSVPLAVLADFTNRQNLGSQLKNQNHGNQQPQHVLINLNNGGQDQKLQTVRQVIPDDISKKVFEMKRRSCGEVDLLGHQQNNFIEQNNQNLMNKEGNVLQGQNGFPFTQRKYSHQIVQETVQTQRDDSQKQKQTFKTQRERNSQKLNPKDQIINFIGKYIKQQNDSNPIKSQEQLQKEHSEQEETLQNLKDFLQYLEDKNIINTKNLENNKEEMTNLIQDLMKLDLHKFSNQKIQKQQNPTQIQNTHIKGSPAHALINNNQNQNNNGLPPSGYQFQLKRNSADQVVSTEVMNELKFKAAQMCSPQVNNHRYLPVNSPANMNSSLEKSNNVVCYYSPLNINGNGNIVNHNVQIYPVSQVPIGNNKAFNCSQKLFNQVPANIETGNCSDGHEIPLRVNAPINGHKRQSSLNEQHPYQQKTPVVLNNKMNFGFGGGQSSQKLIMIDQAECSAQPKPLFHQRKNSMFVQNSNKPENNILAVSNSNNTQEGKLSQSQEDNEAVLCATRNKPKVSHRRAATNYIQPSKIIQTLQPTIQPQVIPSGTGMDPVFNDDYGLLEERDKLIKYIKMYVKQNNEVPQTTLDFYKFIKLIGKGAFGKVTLGIHKLTGKQVAIKTVDKSLMKDDYQKKKVLQEVYLLKKVRHTNVIRLLEVFESPKHLLMVMEYAGGGDLLQYVKKRRRLDETEARKIFRQIVYGLAHCHCRSVLHRDIKLDNILLDNEGEIKICDFGVSRVINKNQRINEQCGTPAYIAPEIISDTGYEGFSADIWSLGVLLYAMICGTVPFKAQNMHDLHQIITSGQFSFPSQLMGILSNESRDLIQRMLILNPKERITIPQILSHPWMLIKDDLMLSDDPFDIQNGMTKQDLMMGTVGEESDINQVNVDNLFPNDDYNTKLSYTDYCSITQDFATMHLDEESLQVMEGFGFTRKQVRDGLNKGDLNHATASYNLLVLN